MSAKLVDMAGRGKDNLGYALIICGDGVLEV